MIKVGVVGCGYWGPNLLRNFGKLDGCTIVGVADPDIERLAYVKRLYPSVPIYESFESLTARADAVAIATPSNSHYEVAKFFLESGRHTMVEKPFTMSSRDAIELELLARSRGLTLMVNHTFIYSGPVRKIRELIDEGELGAVLYYDAVRVNLGILRNDVNVLWDLGPHDLSIMTHLIDQNPIQVSAIGSSPVSSSEFTAESVAYLTIRFDGGTIAHCHLSWLSPVKVRRTLIAGSKKMVVYDHLDPDNQVRIFDKGVHLDSARSRYDALVQYRLGDMVAPKVDQTEALEVACGHFLDCIATDAEPQTGGRHGQSIIELLEAAQVSITQDGRWVDVVQPG